LKVNRWKEPSTWAGIAAALSAVAQVAGPAAPFLLAGAGVCGGVAMVFREG